MKIQIGNTVKWECALGSLTGVVETIVMDKNAANKTIPWLLIARENGPKVRLAGTNDNLAMMKVSVL